MAEAAWVERRLRACVECGHGNYLPGCECSGGCRCNARRLRYETHAVTDGKPGTARVINAPKGQESQAARQGSR